MTPAAKLALLGGDTAPAMSAGIAGSPVFLLRWQRSWPAMFSPMQDPPASVWETLRFPTYTSAQVFDQDVADLTEKASARLALADVWLTAIPSDATRSYSRLAEANLELAEAKWSERPLFRDIGDPAARLSSWLNELTEAPTPSRGSDVRNTPSPVIASEIREQRERNRSAIQLMETWLHEDAAVESDTWELLKSELDRDRLSTRKLWT